MGSTGVEAGCPGAAETGVGFELGEFVEGSEDAFEPFRRAWFFEEEFGAIREASGAIGFGGESGQNDRLQIRMPPMQYRKKLQAIDNGHADVDNSEVDLLVLQK